MVIYLRKWQISPKTITLRISNEWCKFAACRESRADATLEAESLLWQGPLSLFHSRGILEIVFDPPFAWHILPRRLIHPIVCMDKDH